MEKSVTKKSFYNIVSGVFGQLLTIAFGIYIPKLVLVSLGSETNGLLSSVNQILSYLSLLEAGVGNATIQALYGPTAKKNTNQLNGILSATHHYYRRVGVVYLLTILAISLIYPVVVSSQLSNITVFLVVILTGLPNAINFYFQGKYKLLLQVDGRSYVITNITMLINIGTSIGKIVLLSKGFGIVALQLMYLAFAFIQMLIIELYVKCIYPWIDIKVEPDYNALSQKNSVLVHQVSGLIFSSTDAVILSVVCGLKTVSVYSMYTLLFGMVGTLIQNVNNSVTFAMGQAFQTDTQKYQKMHDAYEIYNMALTFALYCVAGICILPFLRLYTSGINDINYIDNILPWLFIATYLLDNGRSASIKAIIFAGHFKQTRCHALLEMGINLTVSIIGVLLWGIYGVIFGTIAALLFRTNAMILYTAKKILKRSPLPTYKRWFFNLVLFVCISVCANQIVPIMHSYFSIICVAIIACIIIVPVFFIANSLIEREAYLYAKKILKEIYGRIYSKRVNHK